MWPLGKRTIAVWVFRCYQSLFISSWHYTWNDHINCLSIKTNHISLCFVRPCLVTRQMFQSTSVTKHGGLFTHSLPSFICFTPSLVVQGLPVWDFSCETCFCLIFWQVGPEFLCLANVTFRFVVMQSIRSFASSICSAYKWIHPHLVEFQYNGNFFLSETLGFKLWPPLGLKFHWTLALIWVKIACNWLIAE